MNKTYKNKDYVPFGIMINKKLLKKLSDIAKEEGRSRSWYFKEGLKKMGIEVDENVDK